MYVLDGKYRTVQCVCIGCKYRITLDILYTVGVITGLCRLYELDEAGLPKIYCIQWG